MQPHQNSGIGIWAMKQHLLYSYYLQNFKEFTNVHENFYKPITSIKII